MAEDKNYFRLVISALILTAVGGLLAGLILVGLANPASFRTPDPESEKTEEKDKTPTGPQKTEEGAVVDGHDLGTGLIAEGEYLIVKANCTGCHSGKLITQNRATREGWEEMIRWMQRTQKLWDLGENEPLILDYLAEHYAPENKGRRQNLVVEQWYEIR
ncbi:MAG: monoheme cytochrome C [Bacteroidota bacterium]